MTNAPSTGIRRIATYASAAFFALFLVQADPSNAAKNPPPDFELKTLSTSPDMVSGGDVVVEVAVPAFVRLDEVVLRLNGQDVSAAFVADSAGHLLTGLITGLREETNTLTVTTRADRSERFAVKLAIKNHAAHGPIFSGPRESPWICETAASGLGAPPASGPCVAPTTTTWFYRTTTNQFAALPSVAPPFPSNLAFTTTIDGHTVPYIVRVESGTINESIYRIAILDDPTNPIANPWSPGGKKPGAGWNGKLTWPFGGGCGAGFRSGSNSVNAALQNDPLRLGFAVAFGTRNTLGTGCNDVISAETVMMLKERFIEAFGLPKFTIGSGGSGGAIQQHLIAQNYPGLLDALTPGISYPDLASIAVDVLDCRLLNNYFQNTVNPADWPGTRRAKVDGYAVATTGPNTGNTVCNSGWLGFANGWQNPTNSFSNVVPIEARYHPVDNPTGARGTYWDSNVNAFGKDPTTGFARSPYDNIGIQYGLKALNQGDITVEEFLHLNESVGGLDIDGNIVAHRTAADLTAVKRGYGTGRFVTSGENLTLPIIDTRGYTDLSADIHTRERTLMFIERLRKANGTAANQVSWTTRGTGAPSLSLMALLGHNEWLERIHADSSDLSYAEKVLRNKPEWLKDACWVDGLMIEEPISWDPSTACNQAIPVHANVRLVAGGPLTGDVIKCRLKPIDFASYKVAFTAEQQARLLAIFPGGVCDWSVPGEGQRPGLSGTWLNYGKGRWGPENVTSE